MVYSLIQVLPFDDTLCVREPCLNYEECLNVLKFGNASGFISSNSILFRPIYPVNTFACRCPKVNILTYRHYISFLYISVSRILYPCDLSWSNWPFFIYSRDSLGWENTMHVTQRLICATAARVVIMAPVWDEKGDTPVSVSQDTQVRIVLNLYWQICCYNLFKL